MYEVRWMYIDGDEDCEAFIAEDKAYKTYEDIKEFRSIDSVGIYYTDGDGNEKELASWSR